MLWGSADPFSRRWNWVFDPNRVNTEVQRERTKDEWNSRTFLSPVKLADSAEEAGTDRDWHSKDKKGEVPGSSSGRIPTYASVDLIVLAQGKGWG
mgnify:CR=1 FL=1